jgi:Glycosyltransferase like family 2
MPDRDVMLAFPHPGSVRTEFMLSVFDACTTPDSRVGELRDFRTGPAMSTARNQITRVFLDSALEWLWMVDADMIISPRTLPALLAAADPVSCPVLGALCFIQSGPTLGDQVPNMYSAVRHEGRFTFKSFEEFPLGEPVQVAATGGACLLIHRDVFAAISKTDPDHDGLWFAEIVADGNLFGEDFSFCMRACRAGIPVRVHTGVQVGHTKSAVIGTVSP